MYAIVQTGGKQYKVIPGQTVKVDKLPAEEGSSVELDRVLLVATADKVIVGCPTVEGARVIASVLNHGRGEKVIVFKYKPKTRYRRKKGHRQLFTSLKIQDIVTSDGAGE